MKRLYDAAYGAMLPVATLYEGRFDDYTAVTVALPVVHQQEGLHAQPASTYSARITRETGQSCLRVIRKFSLTQRRKIWNYTATLTKQGSMMLSRNPWQTASPRS